LKTSETFLNQLEKTIDGFIAYKCFGNTTFTPPTSWKIEPDSVLTESVNPTKTDVCGCGINVCNQEWMSKNQLGYTGAWWKVLIPWSATGDMVIPFGTDGKFRVGKCILLCKIDTPT
jgi:hypothetical protein